MLQGFRTDVAKVGGVLYMLQLLYMYVANVSSQYFIYFFRRMLQVHLSGCCIYFTHMSQAFYLDVAYVLQLFSSVFSGVFASVSYACFKCCIRLQTYVASVYLNVSKVNRVLHLPPCFLLPYIFLRLRRGPVRAGEGVRRGLADETPWGIMAQT
jgi:hypothetical protein